MDISIADWQFRVDVESTRDRTIRYSADHCMCAYCRNYYETVDEAHPRLRQVLGGFGIELNGPSEVMPLEHNVILSCYRVTGNVLHSGSTRLFVDQVPLFPEEGEDGTFLIWAGPMELPWVQEECPEDVISPANEPEFLDRMARKWLSLSEGDLIFS